MSPPATTPAPGGLGGLLNNFPGWLWQGFSNPGGGTGLGGLLSGLTGSTNPLFDIMAILSFVNEGQLTQEQSDFMKKVLGAQGGALNTVQDPNKQAAWTTALTPQGYTPQQYGDIANELTGTLSGPFVADALNPVNAELAASGQNESTPIMQYVSERALAPYSLQLSEMGQQGANQMVSQKLAEQGMGESATNFGLSLPASTPYGIPNFSVSDPNSMNDLVTLLNSGNPNSSTNPANLIQQLITLGIIPQGTQLTNPTTGTVP